jgi:apolipoprotein N-acyltransferase
VVFGLFVVLSAVQFLIYAWVHHALGARVDAWALRAPLSMVVSELVAIRLFDWHFGHTQIALTPLVQVADVGGALLVTFLVFWIAEAAVRVVVFRERRSNFLAPLAALVATLGYGGLMMMRYDKPAGPEQEVVLVQGNSPLSDIGDPVASGQSVGRLYEMSGQAVAAVRERTGDSALVVWAEGAIPAFLPAELRSVREQPVLPWFGDGSAFLVGTYTVDRETKRYNTAFAVRPDGTVPPPYYKQVLIPFGEYMPLASTFPALRALNDRAGVFTAGSGVRVFELPMGQGTAAARVLKVAPLICYEDTVPSIARAATLAGAQLLVKLT